MDVLQNVLRDLMRCEDKDSQSACARLKIYTKLFTAWRWSYRHPGNTVVDVDEMCFNNELKELDVASACFTALKRYSGRQETQVLDIVRRIIESMRH